VRKKTVRRADPDSNLITEPQPWEVEFAHDLPDVPVLPETLLRLDLESQEPSVDLREISQVVLSDLGATVQILRLSGLECDEAEFRPTRIEDCISALGLAACIEAVSAQTISRDSRFDSISETWAHSREIAHYSRLVAEDMPDVNPDEAYMVGLLHTIGLLPQALGWYGNHNRSVDAALAGLQMARQWSLPRALTDYFRDVHLESSATPWPKIVHKAHSLSSRSAILCPLERGVRPLLYRAV
jgi:HD-like signal output (HDOD) protein